MTTYSDAYTNPRNHNTVTTSRQHTSEIEKLRAAMATGIQTGFTALDAATAAAVAVNVTQSANIVTLSTAGVIRVPIGLAANSTFATYVEIPKAATVTRISLMSPTAFASTGGTITLAVKKTNSAGNTMLSAATFDIKTLVADTLTAMTLTATGADLGVAANGTIYIAIVSNNADATGPIASAAMLTIGYTTTVA